MIIQQLEKLRESEPDIQNLARTLMGVKTLKPNLAVEEAMSVFGDKRQAILDIFRESLKTSLYKDTGKFNYFFGKREQTIKTKAKLEIICKILMHNIDKSKNPALSTQQISSPLVFKIKPQEETSSLGKASKDSIIVPAVAIVMTDKIEIQSCSLQQNQNSGETMVSVAVYDNVKEHHRKSLIKVHSELLLTHKTDYPKVYKARSIFREWMPETSISLDKIKTVYDFATKSVLTDEAIIKDLHRCNIYILALKEKV